MLQDSKGYTECGSSRSRNPCRYQSRKFPRHQGMKGEDFRRDNWPLQDVVIRESSEELKSNLFVEAQPEIWWTVGKLLYLVSIILYLFYFILFFCPTALPWSRISSLLVKHLSLCLFSDAPLSLDDHDLSAQFKDRVW